MNVSIQNHISSEFEHMWGTNQTLYLQIRMTPLALRLNSMNVTEIKIISPLYSETQLVL